MKIIKTKVNAKTRQLSANWTVEQSQDLICDDLTKTLQEEIDKEVILEILGASLVDRGWTKVPNFLFDIDELQNWLAENTSDDYRCWGKSVYFKSSKDATLYVLKWAGDDTRR